MGMVAGGDVHVFCTPTHEHHSISRMHHLIVSMSNDAETVDDAGAETELNSLDSLFERIKAAQPATWLCPRTDDVSVDDATRSEAPNEFPPVTAAEVAGASRRLRRFAPLLAHLFPATAANDGLVESELIDLPTAFDYCALSSDCGASHSPSPSFNRVLLKADCNLPIAGSIKARGGVHEVLCYAERLAIESGLLPSLVTDTDAGAGGDDGGDLNTLDDTTTRLYAALDSEDARALFAAHSIVVGSTGNLGVSIGLTGASLGFSVTVHMSHDARAWKKRALRTAGVNVVEHKDDYGAAVAEGRRQAAATPNCHFVDDERIRELMLGYAVAAERLKAQLDARGVVVDAAHPLFVYLPCGVGGAPGGVCVGLKLLYGAAVHCVFAEPTQSPSVLLALLTGKGDAICVRDYGLTNNTVADGLACARASPLCCALCKSLLSAAYTVKDAEMLAMLAALHDTMSDEGNQGATSSSVEAPLRLEPSALAGLCGPWRLARVVAAAGTTSPIPLADVVSDNATHVVWLTGGSLVPDEEWQDYYNAGKLAAAS
jgi:D-serine dehydratase